MEENEIIVLDKSELYSQIESRETEIEKISEEIKLKKETKKSSIEKLKVELFDLKKSNRNEYKIRLEKEAELYDTFSDKKRIVELKNEIKSLKTDIKKADISIAQRYQVFKTQEKKELKELKKELSEIRKTDKEKYKDELDRFYLKKDTEFLKENEDIKLEIEEIKAINKNVNINTNAKKLSKRWFIDAFTGMAMGLFATLIIGTIIKQLGLLIGNNAVGNMLQTVGSIACCLMGAGIGAGIAHALKADKLVIFACLVAGFIGAQSKLINSGTILEAFTIAKGVGDPIGAYFASLIACELGQLVKGKTKVDIIVVPVVVIISALLVVVTICPGVVWLVDTIGQGIRLATQIQPFFMGIIISAVVGVLLTMPTSSAAICIALSLSGLAGGAAVVGCAAQMVGFAVMSFKENKWGGLIAQGLGTSMLQIPNIFKNPRIFIPPIVASIIAGPLATCVFGLQCDATGSGMGTSGLVGVIGTVSGSSGNVETWLLIIGIALLFFILPAVICFFMGKWFRKKGWIKDGDLKLDL